MASTLLLAQAAGIFAWYNVIFVALFGLGFIFTLLQLIGMGHGAGADADADAHADADVDAHLDADAHMDIPADADMDAHVDVDADAHVDAGVETHVDVDGDAHLDAHADADTAAHTGAGANGHTIGIGGVAAQLLALGKVPLSMSLMLLCYTVGITGWIANNLLEPRMGDPTAFFPVSLLAALVAGLIVLRIVGGLMARYLPPVATSAIPRRQLVGMTAKAVLPVNERFGQACLYDPHGTLHVVGCRVHAGAPAIEKGAKVVLVKYIADRDLFEVGRA